MKLTIVGCSGSYPGPESPASSYLVSAEADGRTWKILLDFGNGALGALQKHCEVDQLDAVLISHLHPDHCLDLCGYYVVRNYDPLGRFSEPLPVFTPPGGLERITRAYSVDIEEDLTNAYTFTDIVDRQSIEIGPFTITPFLVNHPVTAFGFRVEADGKVLAYTGDTDACDALVDLERDADLVLTDSAFVDGRDDELVGIHLSGSRAAAAAVEAGAKRLMLTHIPTWTNPVDCVRDAKKHWIGEVELAQAGATYEL